MSKELCNTLMNWSLKNQEYYMAYVLFTEFKTEIPVKLLYELKTRKFVTLDTLHDDSKVVLDSEYSVRKAFLDLMECLKRSKYGQLSGGGFGYVTHRVKS